MEHRLKLLVRWLLVPGQQDGNEASNNTSATWLFDSGLPVLGLPGITLSWTGVTSALLLLVLGYAFYRLYYQAFVWKRDLTDIGYNHVLDAAGNGRNDRRRVDCVNRARRLRKIGDRMPPPYPNGWFAVLESEELRPGTTRAVDCLGQNLAVFRTYTGTVHVLDAYCPHLGANLGIGGVVRGDCIECPFHHWTFSGQDGQCTNIPYSRTGTIPKVARLRKWESLEVNGFIFVWHHADPDAAPWTFRVVQEIEDGRWAYYGKNEFLVNCHIQDVPENGADVAHLAAVHGPNMLSGSDIRYTRAAWADFGMHSWHASWNAPGEGDPAHVATMDLVHSFRLFDKLEVGKIDVRAQQIGPGYVQLMMNTGMGPFVVLQTVTPVEPLVQKVIHRFYAPRNLWNAIFQKFAIWAESVMFERDMMVWNHKQFIENPLLIKEDRLIKAYRKWYSQFYSENSVSFAMAKEKLDW
ncbi:cholesterol 7-desaturase nvd [Anopheles aquasalis]|uniref:cholesterol 7-desaturase nvd n=1 Tax=Anopheles aquasalis TaxID=42839 RepID=UPI00215B1C6B|nr:cholesterol 7-desaturase nvd [Anopheles aquasalis]XP_050084966.1 cholesterol 7-desaturase nvd [Anopheles aquasalis]XP_050084974.1 cholesterol 7-desaturase nvd [Anopheles aquasalis]XP_050084983.1 cholesterol 7-desaturase nvd [Anopheles aquasalis]XP_050084992.1 cholesterol 7-desaturase nvd [Anopheles aquasalis]XP_050085002.1 cholesterol 7-desaturase nvd [Anopheles aquasalis]